MRGSPIVFSVLPDPLSTSPSWRQSTSARERLLGLRIGVAKECQFEANSKFRGCHITRGGSRKLVR
jgi:hypothetical protein